MGDVDKREVRTDAERNAFHGTRVVVPGPEVRKQGDEGGRHGAADYCGAAAGPPADTRVTAEGLRKSTSRRFVLSSTFSEICNRSNRRWMSRFTDGVCFGLAE